MQVNLENKQGLKRHLEITLPADIFLTKHKAVLERTAKKAKIDGFRKGKVPVKIVAERFAEAIFEETVDDLINKSLYEAFTQEKVFPVDRPTIKSVQAKEGEPLTYVAEFEVAPTIEVINFDDVSIEKVDAEITDADIDFAIAAIAEQAGAFVLKEGACANDDRITFDFEGSIEGEKFAGGTAKNHVMVLGKGEMIPGFEDAIVGMKAGDEKIIDVTFPEDYQADLAGKLAQFKINLSKVEEKKVAEVDAALAKRAGVTSGDLEEFKQEIRKALARELNTRLRSDLHKTVFDKLLELNPIDVPDSIVHKEIHHLMDEAKERFKKMTGQTNIPDLPHELFKPQAVNRVRNSYLMLKLVEDNQLKPDATAMRLIAEEMAASYENPIQVRDFFLSDKEHRRNLENFVLEDLIVEHLLQKATVETVKKSYSEVLGKEAKDN
jgi:trigger factor